MSIEQVNDHVFKQMEGDMWCIRCGMPKAAHRFLYDADMRDYETAQRALEQPK